MQLQFLAQFNSDHKNNFENAVKRAVNGGTGAYSRPRTPVPPQLKTVNFVVTANNRLVYTPTKDEQSAASWIALIPFTETRKYVQRVLAYMAIYDWRMGEPVTPLWKHMPKVMPKAYYATSGN